MVEGYSISSSCAGTPRGAHHGRSVPENVPQTIIQAVWEAVATLNVTGPLGRARQEFRKMRWQLLLGWWKLT